MNSHLSKINSELAPLRQQLINHPLYAQVTEVEDFQAFMEQHIFAVWDFMSLLKALQRGLTCIELPWKPVGSPTTRRFINEIVLGEESDVDANGEVSSHFELYIDAMNQIGASSKTIANFLESVEKGLSVQAALETVAINPETRAFVNFTFSILQTNSIHRIASVFTFGREDLIPDMFIQILREMQSKGQQNISKLLYYLERHIEVDGDDHGPISLKMMEELCGNDEQKWNEALESAKDALQMRIQLWNGLLK
ncbi:MAG: DUF3050 domain-containing protein [Crocinitomicaceae bacterium]|nr:DUF3050 domain-containing protein [Crocinitomicaceae bacterium]NCA19513.1 DUF3050 domain-containing protein [Crocinitomicaceae bacterium]